MICGKHPIARGGNAIICGDIFLTQMDQKLARIEGRGYCNWDAASEITRRYHDAEWGVPVHDDVRQFEFLMMEVMQCGLNWNMMMLKRETFRACFDGFDFRKVAGYGDKDIQRILATPDMVRSPRKVAAIIENARRFAEMADEFGSFSAWLWEHTDGKTIIYDRHPDSVIPAANGLSARISKALRQRGFKYLGPTTVYSHLQACGMINDHSRGCPRFAFINSIADIVRKRRDHGVGVVDYAAPRNATRRFTKPC